MTAILFVMLDVMTADDHDDEQLLATDLEQLARSLAMDGTLARRDAQRGADALRRLAAIERASAR